MFQTIVSRIAWFFALWLLQLHTTVKMQSLHMETLGVGVLVQHVSTSTVFQKTEK